MKNARIAANALAVAVSSCLLAPAYALDVQIPVATSKSESAASSVVDLPPQILPQAQNEQKPQAKPADPIKVVEESKPAQPPRREAKTQVDAGQSGRGDRYLEQVGMPEVPASVLRRGDDAPSYTGMAKINDAAVLTMEPGVNQIVPVAIGHLNRIVTPFGTPVVTTMTADATTEVRQNVVYVGTNGEDPVTAFITEKGDQSRALSLTLVPQRIPPRELFVRMADGYNVGVPYSNPAAEKWETSQPYVETVRSVFRSVALGELPQGYAMSKITGAIRLPNCHMSGLSFDFSRGQVLSGHSLSVLIGVARNTAGVPVEFKEAACGDWDVAAVAAWPRNVLEPGERTEIYVARKVNTSKPATSKRPSLLGGY